LNHLIKIHQSIYESHYDNEYFTAFRGFSSDYLFKVKLSKVKDHILLGGENAMTQISIDALRRIVREEVKRALLEALAELLPEVSEEEQEEIERIAGKPSDYKEEDFIEWSGR
jgi:lipoate-protein ligase A